MRLEVHLRHDFGGFALDVAFTAAPGVTALFGRSGAGKTSVVKALAGLLRPREALIRLGERVLVDTASATFTPPHRRRIGQVFQDGRLFPHLSVRANLLFGQRFIPPGTARPALEPVVEMLGVGPLLARRPATLSGGEKQRVAIGRALLAAPEMLLMDEPLASLDAERRAGILPWLERLRDEVRIPILYVSHEIEEVARLATTLVILEAGRVVRAGPLAEVMAEPEAVPHLGARAAGSVLMARVLAHDEQDGLSTLQVSGGRLFLPRVAAPVGTSLRLRLHAHDIMLALDPPGRVSALNILPVIVASIHEGEGPGAILALQAGEDRLLARITRRSLHALGLRAGMSCHAVLKSVAVAQGDVGAVAQGDVGVTPGLAGNAGAQAG